MDHLRPSWPAEVPLTWEKVAAGDAVSYDLIVVKEDVSRKAMSYILEHIASFPGVEIRKNYLRAYPHGSLAAHLLGNMGEITKEQLREQRFKGYSAGDLVGQGGLEWSYDRWLRGRDGVAKVEVDAFGRPKQTVAVPGGRLPEPGDTLVTTIDAKVQAKAEEALRYAIDLAHKGGQYKAAGGAALVLDVKTGEVIAMASFPTYDPDVWVGGISTKDYKKLADPQANRPLLNRAIQEQKAVASTFKVVDAVAGLEEGVIAPSTSFFCAGSFKVPISSDDTVWNCWALDGHGNLDLVQAITQSCDVYFYNVGYLFYQRKGTELADWAMRLGMGRPTGIDVPGEVVGRVPTPAWRRAYFESEVDKLWTPGNSVNLSIGQGDLEATPLQLAVTYAAIANGGSVVQPHIGKKIVDAQGNMVRDFQTAKPRKVDISQSTLDVVRRGLYEAANSVDGHLVGGVRRLPGGGRRQDRHRRGLRRRRLRLVRELRAGQRSQVRRGRDDRAGRPRRHRRGAGNAAHLRRPVQHQERQGHRRREERLSVDWRGYLRHLDYILVVATLGLITYGIMMIYFATRHDVEGRPLLLRDSTADRRRGRARGRSRRSRCSTTRSTAVSNG